jgi:hypothetical protein
MHFVPGPGSIQGAVPSLEGLKNLGAVGWPHGVDAENFRLGVLTIISKSLGVELFYLGAAKSDSVRALRMRSTRESKNRIMSSRLSVSSAASGKAARKKEIILSA